MSGRAALFLALLLSACSSAGGEPAPLEVGPSYARIMRNSDSLVVFFTNTAEAFEFTCIESSTLAKANGDPWHDERPAPCLGEPYYLDDAYVPNLCARCDVLSCTSFASSKTFGTQDFLQTGTRPPPDGVTEAPADVPVIESAADLGPYLLTIRYYADSTCSEPIAEKTPIVIDASSDGGDDTGGGGY